MNNNEKFVQLLSETQHMLNIIEQCVNSGIIDAITLALLQKKCVAIYEQLLQIQPDTTTPGKGTVYYNPPNNPLTIIDEPTPDEVRPLIEEQINKADETVKEELTTAPIEQPELKPVNTLFTQQEIENTIQLKRAEEALKKTEVFTLEESHELSLHEKLSLSTEKRPGLVEKMQQQVESLKAAISLNKKIAFVNHLFGENTVDYAKSIEKLNQSSNLDEALRYFSELKVQYQWDSNNELVKDLEQLVIKRFS